MSHEYDETSNADALITSEMHEQNQANEFADDAADDARHAELEAAEEKAAVDDGEPWEGYGEER